MKKYCLLFVCTLLLLGCKKYDDSALWDSVNNLKDRVTQLEELCKQVNTNITALQTIVSAVQSNDCITAVTPIKSGNEEIGYTIAFANHDPITIYHGKDGIKGADGNDAQPPMIGVQQHDDGIYYWTLNGEWLTDPQGNKVKAQGNDGSTGKSAYELAVEKGYSGSLDEWLASLNGTNGDNGKSAYELAVEKGYQGTIEEWLESLKGSQGQQGATGNNGITPKLKIGDDNYWYVSYDNEASWVSLNVKATGENGKDAESIKVTEDDNNVYFELASGTVITLPKSQQPVSQNIVFEDEAVKAICIANWDINLDGELSYEEAKEVTSIGTNFQGRKDIKTFDELQYFTSLLSIEENAFKSSSLTSITLPRTMKFTTIDKFAFAHCSALTSIKIPFNIQTIREYAFYRCYALTTVTFEKSSQLKTIGQEAFRENGFQSIAIPASVETIGGYAFEGCTALTTVTFEKGSQLKTITTRAFHATGLQSIEIPASVETIEVLAFGECTALTTVTFEKSSQLKTIQGGYGGSISFGPDGGQEYFQCGAFCNLPNLRTVDMSACTQVEDIRTLAFASCSNLQLFKIGTVTPPACTDSYGPFEPHGPFGGLPSTSILKVPAGSEAAYRQVDGWKEFSSISALN